jgi:DNA-binding transcriptional LysR family regulator
MSLTIVELRLLRGLVAGKSVDDLGAEFGLDAFGVVRAVRAAEARTRLKLVTIDGRRMIATPVAEHVASAANRLVAQMNGLDQFISALRVRQSGPIRVLAAYTPINYVLPKLLGRFMRKHPYAEFQLQGPSASPPDWATARKNLAELFLGGTYDFAVLPVLPQLPEPLLAEALYDDVAVFFASPKHPLFGRGDLTLNDLRDEAVAGMFIETMWADIAGYLAGELFTHPQQITLHSSEAVKRVVAAGVGVGVLLYSAIRDEVERGTLGVLVVPQAEVFQRKFALVRHPDAPASPLALEFCRFLREQLATSTPALPITKS